MANRPGTYVKVLYDYSYNLDDGTKVTIKEGDKYLLLKKANDEWWRVVRVEDKKPIYVPAEYVEVIPRESKPPPATAAKRISKHEAKKEEETENAAEEAQDCDTKSTDSSDHLSSPGAEEDGSSEEVLDSEPDYMNIDMVQKAIQTTSEQQTALKSSPDYANLADFNLPAPKPLPEQQPTKELPGDWVVYDDEATGQQFFFNKVTEESSWKPPRTSKESTGSGVSADSGETNKLTACNSFGTAVSLTSAIDGEVAAEDEAVDTVAMETLSYGGGSSALLRLRSNKVTDKRFSMPISPSVPIGWREETVDGKLYYINEVTNEKWLNSVDESSGRMYFYKEDAGESAWLLPEVAPSHRHGSWDASGSPVPTIRSLSRSLHGSRDGRPQLPVLPPKLPSSISSPTLVRENFDCTDSNSLPRSPRSPRVIPAKLPVIPDNVSPDEPAPSSPANAAAATTFVKLSDDEPLQMRAQQGILNKTKISENGKKCKKNWMSSYVIIDGPRLYFYKDQKAAQSKKDLPTGKFDVEIELNGATVEFGGKKTSKKNVIQLLTVQGVEYLLQTDDDLKIHEWFITLKNNIQCLGPKKAGSVGSLGSLNDSGELELLDDDTASPALGKNRRKASQKHKAKTGGTGTFERQTAAIDDPSLPQAEKTNRIRVRLKNFFTRRPDIEVLQQKGYIKDRVFNSTLVQLYERDKVFVPRFVTEIMMEIEKRGLSVDGIYRVNGNAAQMHKLRSMVDQNEKYDLGDPEMDIHVLSGTLKLFFRELKEPLVPFNLFDEFLEANKTRGKEKQRLFKKAIKALPAPNRETMKELFLHLCNVMKHSQENRMQSQNIAIVFGPTLLWPELAPHNVAVTMVCQNQIVEYILLEYRHLLL